MSLIKKFSFLFIASFTAAIYPSTDSLTITYDTLIQNNISTAGENDFYFFFGMKGDLVCIEVNNRQYIQTCLRVYDEKNTLLCLDTMHRISSILNYNIPESGKYCITTGFKNIPDTGSYLLSFYSIKNQNKSLKTFNYGDLIIDTVNKTGEIKAFQLFGPVNSGYLRLWMINTSITSQQPPLDYISLYRKDTCILNKLFISYNHNEQGINFSESDTITAIITHEYFNTPHAFIIRPRLYNSTKIDTEAQTISNNTVIYDSLEPFYDTNIYKFNILAGDSIKMRLSAKDTINSSFQPKFENIIHRPFEDYRAFRADRNGKYSIIVRDENGKYGGKYQLSVESKFFKTLSAQKITYGFVVSDSLSEESPIKCYEFNGTETDTLKLYLDTIYNFWETFQPTLFDDQQNLIPRNQGSGIHDYILPKSGKFFIFLNSPTFISSYRFNFRIQCMQQINANTHKISFNTPVYDTLSVIGDIHPYTFFCDSGDKIAVKTRNISGVIDYSIDPEIVLLYQSDSRVIRKIPANNSIDFIPISSSGIYTMYLMYKKYTGITIFNVSVYSWLLSKSQASTILYNSTVSDTFETIKKFKMYKFNGLKGDMVRMCYLEKLDSVYAVISGVALYDSKDSLMKTFPFFLEDCLLPESGEYSLVLYLRDSYVKKNYSFQLHCIRYNHENAQVMQYGTYIIDTVKFFGNEINCYKFSGKKGDKIIARLLSGVKRQPFEQPQIDLLDRNDSIIKKGNSTVGSWINNFLLPKSDTFFLYVYDKGFHDTGTFMVSLHSWELSKANAKTIQYNTLVQNTALNHSFLDFYQFYGTAGDRVTIRAFSGTSIANIELLNQFDSVLCKLNSIADAFIDDFILPSPGKYSITINDIGFKNSNINYYLSLQCFQENKSREIPIQYGTSLTDTLLNRGDIALYRFEGKKDNPVSLSVTADSSYRLRLKLYGPNDSVLVKIDSTIGNIDKYILPLDGTYYALVRTVWLYYKTCSYRFSLGKCNQQLKLLPFPEKKYNDTAFTPNICSSSGLPVTYSSSDNTIASIDNGKITIKGVGSCYISVYQPGDEHYYPSTLDSQLLVVNKAQQTITFNSLPEMTFLDSPYVLNASSSSGLGISYTTSNKEIAQIQNSALLINGAGSVIITALQEGNGFYLPAVPTIQILNIKKADQIITFNPLPFKKKTDQDFILDGYSSSGLPISYLSLNPTVAIVTVDKVHIIDTGKTNIIASQTGNTNYNPAEIASQELQILNATNIINNGGNTPDTGTLFIKGTYKKFQLIAIPNPVLLTSKYVDIYINYEGQIDNVILTIYDALGTIVYSSFEPILYSHLKKPLPLAKWHLSTKTGKLVEQGAYYAVVKFFDTTKTLRCTTIVIGIKK